MPKSDQLKANMLDRAIAYVAPGVARKRAFNRAMLAASGGYEGASYGRTLGSWFTTNFSADGAALPALSTLRARSRDLERNAPLALGTINTKTTNVVGAGLFPEPTIDAKTLGISADQAQEISHQVLEEFSLWAESSWAVDYTGGQNFYELQDLVYRSRLSSGDVFSIKRYLERGVSPYALKIQIAEADLVCNPSGRFDDARLKAGIELSPSGSPQAIYVANRHPGEVAIRGAGPVKWTRVPIFGRRTGDLQVLHHFRRLRAGQTRGVPELAPVIQKLKELTRYTEAEIRAAVISSCFAVVTKTENAGGLDVAGEARAGDGETLSDGDPIQIVEPGTVVDLGANETIENFDVSRPNSGFDPFIQAVLRQIGVALEIPFELLILHFTASYSASRAALLQFWKFVRRDRQWLAASFCQPVYSWLIEEGVARGRLDLPGFLEDPRLRRAYLRCTWHGAPMGALDPGREATAADKLISAGVSTVNEQSLALTGRPFSEKIDQIATERRSLAEAGLGSPSAPPAPAEPVDPVDPDQPDKEE